MAVTVIMKIRQWSAQLGRGSFDSSRQVVNFLKKDIKPKIVACTSLEKQHQKSVTYFSEEAYR